MNGAVSFHNLYLFSEWKLISKLPCKQGAVSSSITSKPATEGSVWRPFLTAASYTPTARRDPRVGPAQNTQWHEGNSIKTRAGPSDLAGLREALERGPAKRIHAKRTIETDNEPKPLKKIQVIGVSKMKAQFKNICSKSGRSMSLIEFDVEQKRPALPVKNCFADVLDHRKFLALLRKHSRYVYYFQDLKHNKLCQLLLALFK